LGPSQPRGLAKPLFHHKIPNQAVPFPHAHSHFCHKIPNPAVSFLQAHSQGHPLPACQVSTLQAMASAHLALKQYGAAALHCTEALDLEPCNAATLMLRARARMLRRDYQVRTCAWAWFQEG